MVCGLLGRKLGHSYSPQIHAGLGDYSYTLLEKEPEELEVFLKSGSFDGLNVTIPYKKAVIPFLDELSDRAAQLGAVNTIVCRNGRLIGHNTDFFGFFSMLARSGLEVSGKKALVLGSGGASNTVCQVLRECGAQVVVISRSGADNYDNLERHADASLIVNATPVGMYPNVESAALDLSKQRFERLEGVLDLIYNPARTSLLLAAEEKGLVTANGLWMLVAQAKESAEWFTGKKIPENRIGEIYRDLKSAMENTVFIGMPGCGKTTVGIRFAEAKGKRFVDVDEEITARTGRSPAQIICEEGEAAFRQIEHGVLADLGKQSGLVIATGGGCVTKPENYAALHRNGNIYWLTRDLEKLPTTGRPLSQADGVAALYRQREKLYRRFADQVVDNNGSLDETMKQLNGGKQV